MLFVGALLLFNTLLAVQTWFMGYWAEQYDIYPPCYPPEQVDISLQVFISLYFVVFADEY